MATHVTWSRLAAPPATFDRTDVSRFLAPAGRILFGLIFVLSSLGHFSPGIIAYAADHGVPMARLLVPLSGVMALLGGLSVMFGFMARIGAALLIVFLVPVILTMHRFWGVADPNEAMVQQIMFMKNLSMLGGALLLAYFGAGPLSFDQRKTRKELPGST